MAEYSNAGGVYLEVDGNKLVEFVDDVRVHPVMGSPFGLRRVEVEAGGRSEIIALVVPVDLHASKRWSLRDLRKRTWEKCRD